jgi:hypothetical protein
MQKTLLTITCFFFPIIIFPDITPIIQLVIAVILYEAKAAIVLLFISLCAAVWSFMALIKFLFSGFRIRHLIELTISILVCIGAASGTKAILKNIHKRPVRILRMKLSLLSDFYKLKNDLAETRHCIIAIRNQFRVHIAAADDRTPK